MVGLISSFLTAYCIYPLLKVPNENKRNLKILQVKNFSIPSVLMSPIIRIISVSVLVLILITILFLNPHGLKIKTDFGALYTMSPFLEESEKKAALALDHGSSPLYFIISGKTAEETLKNEEWLILQLEEEVIKGNLSSFIGTSVFVPSLKQQERTYKAMSALLLLTSSQYKNLGFPPEYEQVYHAEYAAGETYYSPEDVMFMPEVSNLWIGEIKGVYYSCVFPFNTKDSHYFKSIADKNDFVSLINKEEDITRDLDTLTETIVLLFFIGYFIVAIIIFIVYPWKKSIKILLTPVLGILAALAILSLKGTPLSFLHISALILVFGLGIDFSIFMASGKDNKEKKLVRFAIFLSFLTSGLSFGILTFSNFAPVNIFGFTVAVGLAAAFVFTMLLQGLSDS